MPGTIPFVMTAVYGPRVSSVRLAGASFVSIIVRLSFRARHQLSERGEELGNRLAILRKLRGYHVEGMACATRELARMHEVLREQQEIMHARPPVEFPIDHVLDPRGEARREISRIDRIVAECDQRFVGQCAERVPKGLQSGCHPRETKRRAVRRRAVVRHEGAALWLVVGVVSEGELRQSRWRDAPG